MEKLFKFLNYINEAEHITADTEKERDGQWVVNRNKTNADYEGGDYQQPRVAIMYDGKQGQNGWYWELITGKDVVASGDHTYKTADDAKEAAQFYMADAETDYDEEDLGRLGEGKLIIYDNGGKSADQFTVVIDDDVYGMSTDATAPNGFNQYAGSITNGDIKLGPHLGKKVKMNSLPDAVKKAIKQRMT